MKVFDEFKSMNIDEFAEWLDKYGMFDGSPWLDWWDGNYCSNCDAVVCYVPYLERDSKVSWCELYNKCKFFPNMNDVPNSKEIIEMWLESESNIKR